VIDLNAIEARATLANRGLFVRADAEDRIGARRVLYDDVPALVAEVRRLRMREAAVWDEGYEAAYQMARGWGHVDQWEAPYPANPYEPTW
jgi:hypothetical protein